MTPQQGRECQAGQRVRWMMMPTVHANVYPDNGTILEVTAVSIWVKWDSGPLNEYRFNDIHGGFFHLVKA